MASRRLEKKQFYAAVQILRPSPIQGSQSEALDRERGDGIGVQQPVCHRRLVQQLGFRDTGYQTSREGVSGSGRINWVDGRYGRHAQG